MSFHDTTPQDPPVAVLLAHSDWGRLEDNLRLMSEDLHEMAREKDDLPEDRRRDLEEEARWLVGIADTIAAKRLEVDA
jgi:hypothetical protein